MNNYQQQQQMPAMPTSFQTTPQMSVYQQYGSSSMGSNNLNTNMEGMITYPTSQMYQQANTFRDSWKDYDSYYNLDYCMAGTLQVVPPSASTPPCMSDPVTKAVMDNILGKLPTKKSAVMFRCDVCDQEFSGRSVLDTHLAGAKHAKKIKSREILNQLTATGQNFSQGGLGGNFRCEACGIEANSSQQLQTHLAGNKHKQRMLKLEAKTSAPSPPPISASSAMPPPPAPASNKPQKQQLSSPSSPGTSMDVAQRFYCEVCKVHLNSSLQKQQHVESRKHKDKEAGASNSNKHHPYRRVPQTRFQQSIKKKKKQQPIAFLTPLSSSFVSGSML